MCVFTHVAPQVHEASLVRDCVFAAQGLEGNHVRFVDDDSAEGHVLCELQEGTVESQLVRKLAELGWLVRCWMLECVCCTSTRAHAPGGSRR